jgi:hypothetical protein
VDWVAGGITYGLDGSSSRPLVNYAFPFDAVAALAGSEFCVIYQRLGTKALLLRNGKIIRELDRSFYCAESYEYPVCLLSHASRTLLVHCPDEYNQIEIEDAATGECLTRRTGKADDCFHSRLQPSPNGVRVLSAGWIWHPLDIVRYFDVAEALAAPDCLNRLWSFSPASGHDSLVEETSAWWVQASATWLNDDIAVLTGGDAEDDPEEGTPSGSGPRGMVSIDLPAGTIRSSCVLEKPAGTIMRCGPDHVISFHDPPKLVRLRDGVIERSWPHISSGKQTSSIVSPDSLPPPLAMDPECRRFAVAGPDAIHVVLAD